MTDRSTQLARLLPMLEAVYQSRYTQLTAVARRIADLKAQVADLDRPKTNTLTDPATRVGADILWETWVMGRKTKLQREIAMASRDLENMRGQVAQALSKLEVARTLEEKMRAQQKQDIERRVS